MRRAAVARFSRSTCIGVSSVVGGRPADVSDWLFMVFSSEKRSGYTQADACIFLSHSLST